MYENPPVFEEPEQELVVAPLCNSARRNPYEVAAACEQIGRPSGQFTTFLLPEEFGYDMPVGDDIGGESVPVPRVIKVGHTAVKATRAVAELMDISDSVEKAEKPSMLLATGQSSLIHTVGLAHSYAPLARLFGNPEICNITNQSILSSNTVLGAYTQDYAPPVWQILEKLDMDDPIDFAVGAELVESFVATTLILAGFSLHNITLKFADDCGVRILGEENKNTSPLPIFQVSDLGEHTYDKRVLHQDIEDRRWEELSSHKEYTKLHPKLQSYLNQRLKEELTHERIDEIWGVSLETPASDTKTHASLIDTTIPQRLPQVLWERYIRKAATQNPDMYAPTS